MNKAESGQIASYLELLGYTAASAMEHSGLIVLNTCVVRQSAEDKILGMLSYLKGIKQANPELVILVTGCFVDSKMEALRKRFPYVALFFKPGAYEELITWAEKQGKDVSSVKTGSLLPEHVSPCVFVPIIRGCNNFCSYCVVPYRRGREKSRPLTEIVDEIDGLSRRGVREVTLLGQNVNSYGHDLPSQPGLSGLLVEVCKIENIARVRFLTNHPKDMSRELMETVASMDKVCRHIILPLQAGDDDILRAMRRGYTVEQYRKLVDMTRSTIPSVALSTDVIVGFPGETEEQFGRTLSLIEEIKFVTVHAAIYSPRPGTIATRKYADDVPSEIKKGRFNKIEAIQTKIACEMNSQLLNSVVRVLVEGQKKGKWYGRTTNDRLVFFEDGGSWLGRLVNIKISKTSPWSLQGNLVSCRDSADCCSGEQSELCILNVAKE
jgi:tRNA-2-methylthio-N6-dimethylallyladenosine synthase